MCPLEKEFKIIGLGDFDLRETCEKGLFNAMSKAELYLRQTFGYNSVFFWSHGEGMIHVLNIVESGRRVEPVIKLWPCYIGI